MSTDKLKIKLLEAEIKRLERENERLRGDVKRAKRIIEVQADELIKAYLDLAEYELAETETAKGSN